MEPKKTKKLEIKKEVIANLNDQSMSWIKGGGTTGNTCPDWACHETVDEPRCQTIPYNGCPIETKVLLCPSQTCPPTNCQGTLICTSVPCTNSAAGVTGVPYVCTQSLLPHLC